MEYLSSELIMLFLNVILFVYMQRDMKSFFEKCLLIVKSNDIVDYSNYLEVGEEKASNKLEVVKGNKKELTMGNFYDLMDNYRKQ